MIKVIQIKEIDLYESPVNMADVYLQNTLQSTAQKACKEFGWKDVAILYNSRNRRHEFVEYTNELYKTLEPYTTIDYVLQKTGNSTYRMVKHYGKKN